MAARPDIDLVSGDFYADPARFEAYAWMRANEPVYFDGTSGVWGVSSFAAVMEAERAPECFSNANGIRPDVGPQPSMINFDGAAHHQRRRLVSAGFTPRRVADQEPRIREICDALIDAVCERGECDLVRDLAAPLPMAVIGDQLGVLPEDRDELLRWSDDLVRAQGQALSMELVQAALSAMAGYHAYALDVIGKRRAEPTDDLMSVLVHAEVDGERLDDEELVHESLLILVGGDETTRHVISGGVEQLLRHRDQWQLLADDRSRIPVAVEEMLRWVSPIKNMARTVTSAVEFHGAQLEAGRKVLLLFESANFDNAAFDGPDRFDVTRAPNDHLAFGHASHFCLGASLARLELRVMVERLLARLPDLALASGAPLPRRPANFISGIESMLVRFTPTARIA